VIVSFEYSLCLPQLLTAEALTFTGKLLNVPMMQLGLQSFAIECPRAAAELPPQDDQTSWVSLKFRSAQ